jgi:hypothetical protein
MAKTMILFKCDSLFAYNNGIKYVFAPKYLPDIESMSKINGDVKAKIYQPRNLKQHCKLFAIANNIASEGFFEMLLSTWDDAQEKFNIKLNLIPEIIQAIRLQYNNDSYSLIYICKACFLKWEKDIFSGNMTVSSISFDNMDNVEFTDFFNSCLDLWSYILQVSRTDLECNYD